jgi:hypothetical protein
VVVAMQGTDYPAALAAAHRPQAPLV